MLTTDLTASRLCYLISVELQDIKPEYKNSTYKDMIQLALLNFYDTLHNLTDDDLKEFKLIEYPNDLGEFNTWIKYKDDLTPLKKQVQKMATVEGRD